MAGKFVAALGFGPMFGSGMAGGKPGTELRSGGVGGGGCLGVAGVVLRVLCGFGFALGWGCEMAPVSALVAGGGVIWTGGAGLGCAVGGTLMTGAVAWG